MKLSVNRGNSAARQLKRALADSEGGDSRLVNYVDDVLERCEACRPFCEAPHVPIAGTSAVSTFNDWHMWIFVFWMLLLRYVV